MGHLDLAALREEYARAGLDEADLAPDPIAMFDRWMGEAHDAIRHDANAMVLSTVGPDLAPSSRMLLLKGVAEDGFVFFTNTASLKGHELAANPRCSLLFPWHPLERQVRVDGVAAPLPRADVEAYFASRPRASQLGAWASHQSEVVSGRAELEAAYAAAEVRYPDQVPTPEEWGGYVVRPEVVEFWQGRTGRLHDRLRYRRTPGGWVTERLAP
ncbi:MULTISPECIES: pyridoxamine 5'-phosphate oxidase [unclassified Nocardioides]|uniref:Pyridoxine/pyridoxamine 5'-phosphate oxidase n=1 Tax=Nocardioides sp. (strain ATCC BAA-499 / JS614) TaxID=196162 RepID=PDXH_NOCSJ|nr:MULTISPECIES: pyridoxamine 5'-phosphate oxidase [unclassified Nocardioides]A1SEM4.1 RecName: Full=Pyridoxine/pyridoxamine 5'-phosphate oxidase; AltName: Full=PNP/PMP oxidase; Short=PNPOx; AltName: Full=Pyridoxal 5'-phosphate synthase [Nocardioides sp. JS614]ABL80259.1 Pyridoxamine 5'-phosphate oxidase [Nocardioides sp. JS614]MBI2245010.1 pyridoxamine 5'-phosphate oxidase [Nocardioides sp.]